MSLSIATAYFDIRLPTWHTAPNPGTRIRRCTLIEYTTKDATNEPTFHVTRSSPNFRRTDTRWWRHIFCRHPWSIGLPNRIQTLTALPINGVAGFEQLAELALFLNYPFNYQLFDPNSSAVTYYLLMNKTNIVSTWTVKGKTKHKSNLVTFWKPVKNFFLKPSKVGKNIIVIF